MSGHVMGILNVTPDSFSDGNRWLKHEQAIEHGLRMIADGADIIDIGGESTRPAATPISSDEESARILPVIAELAPLIPVSVDTRHADVAEAAVAAGASIINDVSASLWETAAKCQVPWIAMHMQGTPETMQQAPYYDDVVSEVAAFLTDAAERALEAGVPKVFIDPGIGFGKTVEHNCTLLANLEVLTGSPFEVVVGTSRKGFLGQLTERDGIVPTADDRLEGSLATAVMAMTMGASIVRVHDVKATVRAAGVVDAVLCRSQVGVSQ